jgi:hypothetical protein
MALIMVRTSRVNSRHPDARLEDQQRRPMIWRLVPEDIPLRGIPEDAVEFEILPVLVPEVDPRGDAHFTRMRDRSHPVGEEGREDAEFVARALPRRIKIRLRVEVTDMLQFPRVRSLLNEAHPAAPGVIVQTEMPARRREVIEQARCRFDPRLCLQDLSVLPFDSPGSQFADRYYKRRFRRSSHIT